MDAEYLLTSTRAVRKGFDLEAPIDLAEIRECLRIGSQASNGSNTQSWKWIVVTDEGLRSQIAAIYRHIYEGMTGVNPEEDKYGGNPDPTAKLMSSVDALVTNMARIPALVIPVYQPYMGNDGTAFQLATYYGSIFPAAWNFMLALHMKGYGSCITTMHLCAESQIAELLGIPDGYMQGCLIPVGRLPAGKRFNSAPRRPIDEVAVLDRFDGRPLPSGDAA